MKTFASLVLYLGAFALAQSNVTRYYGDECAVISKDVYVSPNGLTFLEFYDSIDAGGVISPGLMIQGAEPSDTASQALQDVTTPFVAAKAEGSNRLDLSTELSAAETPLTVWVKGQPCLLRLTVKPDLVGPQRYIIERSRPLPALSAPPSAPLLQTSAPPSAPDVAGGLPDATPAEATPTVSDDELAQTQVRDLASQLDFKLVSVTAVSNGAANAFFTFTNHSPNIIVLDGTRATFVQNGVRLPTKIRKEPLRGLVQPGETQVGYIVLDDAAPGAGELTWTLQEMGGETRKVVVRETISVPVD
ncbi:hypothetical protein BH24DEI2_BH24DEI2_12130 [soil metagenome]